VTEGMLKIVLPMQLTKRPGAVLTASISGRTVGSAPTAIAGPKARRLRNACDRRLSRNAVSRGQDIGLAVHGPGRT
jgi:hypothetical protein